MKKLLIILLLPIASFAQDTASVNITDSGRMYRYQNVYAAISRVNVNAPGSQRFPTQSDTAKWYTSITVSVYNSKADFKNGKQELFTIYCPILVTDKFPTQKEILDKMRSVIK